MGLSYSQFYNYKWVTINIQLQAILGPPKLHTLIPNGNSRNAANSLGLMPVPGCLCLHWKR